MPLENLNKTACTHHALKALQTTNKDFIKRADYGFSQWRSFMVGNETYAFKHVLNFNLESESLLVILMQSLLALIFKDRFFKSYRLL